MSAIDKLADCGYEDVAIFSGEEYDDALIGVTTDGRAVYEFEKMVECLMNKYEWSDIDAIEWIEYNTIRALPYFGQNAPIIMYSLEYM
jgi:hypothetical protein